MPRAVYVVEEFPTGTLDKLLKNKLREMADERVASSDQPTSRAPVSRYEPLTEMNRQCRICGCAEDSHGPD